MKHLLRRACLFYVVRLAPVQQRRWYVRVPTGESGVSPVHVATKIGQIKPLELICQRYMDQINSTDSEGKMPLHAARRGKVVNLLCKFGADVHARCRAGYTPLQTILQDNDGDDRISCAVALLCNGANINVHDSVGDTPLHWAVQRDDIDLVKLLIVFGADINLSNHNGQTPRHMAAKSQGSNRDDVLQVLHFCAAQRCVEGTEECNAGCSPKGEDNGKGERVERLLSEDSDGLLDDILCSFPSTKSDSGNVGDRVLCLDGGGIRGLVLLQILSEMEKTAGKSIRECFDWIAGTSTGGILSLGIASGLSLSRIRALYFQLKDEVFKGPRPYSSERFENLLKDNFGKNKVMTDFAHPKVLVTGVLADREPAKLHLFRSYNRTLNVPDNADPSPTLPPHEQLVWQAARSSGAAPSYFRKFDKFVDGGLIANNPTLDVLTEIQEHNMGLKRQNRNDEIRPLRCVISLGCGRVPMSLDETKDFLIPELQIEHPAKAVKEITSIAGLFVDQACAANGHPVDRSRAWCSSMHVPFYRLSPRLSSAVPLDASDDRTLVSMMFETQSYVVANKDKIAKIARLISAS